MKQTLLFRYVSVPLASLLVTGALKIAPASADTIKIDGSSTVYPITEAVAEEFGTKNGDIKVTVGISGTGGGFKKFCAGEIDISDASRPIKQVEIDSCKQNGIEYIELPVAFDALSVVVHPSNNWATSITVAELKKLWEPEAQGKIMKWNQIRSSWPDKPIALFGPGVDSGTFDYFTEVIVGKAQSSRGDFTSSEDDNVLVQGVSSNPNALGFFGLAYYTENKGKVKAITIDDGNDANGKGPQEPTVENVIKGVYQPLSRPLFIYASKKALDRPAIKDFVAFYLDNNAKLATEVGYVRVPDEVETLAKSRFNSLRTGTVYSAESGHTNISLAELMKRSS